MCAPLVTCTIAEFVHDQVPEETTVYVELTGWLAGKLVPLSTVTYTVMSFRLALLLIANFKRDVMRTSPLDGELIVKLPDATEWLAVSVIVSAPGVVVAKYGIPINLGNSNPSPVGLPENTGVISVDPAPMVADAATRATARPLLFE